MQFFESVHSDFGLFEDDLHNDEAIRGSVMLKGAIIAYADRYCTEIRCADELKDIIEQPELDYCDIPKENREEGDDPWDWEERLEQYEFEHKLMGRGDLGGDRRDITSWQPKEGREAAFNKKGAR